jgi:hypothetical protein
VYALRKEPDKMFEWLEHGWTTNDPGVTDLLVDPFLRAYKDDPRFIAFAQKIGVLAESRRQNEQFFLRAGNGESTPVGNPITTAHLLSAIAN